MNAVDKNLLLRIARRLEEQAEDEHKRATAVLSDTKAVDQAKRRRDRELGDAKDLREHVKRADTP